jgi:AraC-like DNA-binding protein/quercetin dioxygenase-like cupin family protein
MTKRSEDHEYLQTVPRHVSAMAKSYPPGYAGYMHKHARAQFLYAETGSMRLTMSIGCWIIPPNRAVWLPAGYVHQTGSLGPLEMRTLYVASGKSSQPTPQTPRMLRVSPLLRELVLRATEMPIEYDEAGQDGLVVRTLLGEIDWTPLPPVSLPSLEDPRLQRMEKCLLKRPDDSTTLDQWAAKLRMSPRSLTRLVRKETEMTFQSWRDQIRTFIAIPLLADRKPLVDIAALLGYDTAWSFTSMFKRVTGRVPSQYLNSD